MKKVFTSFLVVALSLGLLAGIISCANGGKSGSATFALDASVFAKLNASRAARDETVATADDVATDTDTASEEKYTSGKDENGAYREYEQTVRIRVNYSYGKVRDKKSQDYTVKIREYSLGIDEDGDEEWGKMQLLNADALTMTIDGLPLGTNVNFVLSVWDEDGDFLCYGSTTARIEDVTYVTITLKEEINCIIYFYFQNEDGSYTQSGTPQTITISADDSDDKEDWAYKLAETMLENAVKGYFFNKEKSFSDDADPITFDENGVPVLVLNLYFDLYGNGGERKLFSSLPDGTADGYNNTFTLNLYNDSTYEIVISNWDEVVSKGTYDMDVSEDLEGGTLTITETAYKNFTVGTDIDNDFTTVEKPTEQTFNTSEDDGTISVFVSCNNGFSITFGVEDDEDGTPAGGTIIIDGGSFTVSKDTETSSSTFYLNDGSISFVATAANNADVTNSASDWTYTLTYGGKELSQEDEYYTVSDNTFSLNPAKPLPIAGTYQLYVAATYEGITSGATVNIVVEDKAYYTFEINDSFGNTFGSAVSSLATPAVFKITGAVTNDVSLSTIASALSSTPYAVGLDLSELTGVTEIARGVLVDASTLASFVIPASVTKIAANAFSGLSLLTSITFPITEGWTYTADNTTTTVDVSDPATNAAKLTNPDAEGSWVEGVLSLGSN